MAVTRTRYRFSHRSDDGQKLYWISDRIPGDSRVEQVSVGVDYFWHPTAAPPTPVEMTDIIASLPVSDDVDRAIDAMIALRSENESLRLTLDRARVRWMELIETERKWNMLKGVTDEQAMELWWMTTNDMWAVPDEIPAQFLRMLLKIVEDQHERL